LKGKKEGRKKEVTIQKLEGKVGRKGEG